MNVDIQCPGSYALAYCQLEEGETMRAEAGAMAAMSDGVKVGVDAGPGGLAKGLVRKTIGGESFFMVKYTAQVHGAWVAVAPKYPGDIAVVHIADDRGLMIEAGSVLALSEGLHDDVKFAGLGNVVLHEGATMQHVHGTGTVLVSAYGGIQRFDLADRDESLVIDTGHLLAFSSGMRCTVGPLSGFATAKLSGEGIVAQLQGPGSVYVQTRAEQDLRGWVLPKQHGHHG